MKFNKHEIQKFLESDCAIGYKVLNGASNTGTAIGYINHIYDEITIDIDLVNDMPAYIYEPISVSWEICDMYGRDGKPDSERAKLNDKLTAYFEKENLEKQISKQHEAPKIKNRM